MDKTVFITGTSTGFGNLLADTLLQNGYTVFATMREPDGRNAAAAQGLRDAARGSEGRLHLFELDVTSDSSVERAMGAALEAEGRVDVVVNNAGYGVGGLCEGFEEEQMQRIFDVNVFGPQRVNRAALPTMRERGEGLLIHVSSMLGRMVLPFCGPYTASKFALEGLAESYRYELAATGVDSVIVEPGGFPTDFGRNMGTAGDEARVASYGPLAEQPRKFWEGISASISGDDAPDPQDVADAIIKLIETPAGRRPLRTAVDRNMAGMLEQVNERSDAIQASVLGSFGMGAMLSVKEA